MRRNGNPGVDPEQYVQSSESQRATYPPQSLNKINNIILFILQDLCSLFISTHKFLRVKICRGKFKWMCLCDVSGGCSRFALHLKYKSRACDGMNAVYYMVHWQRIDIWHLAPNSDTSVHAFITSTEDTIMKVSRWCMTSVFVIMHALLPPFV